MIPACDHTGTPLHFHSSTTSGSACLISVRIRASVSPRQSPSSSILASISREGDSLFRGALFFIEGCLPQGFVALGDEPGDSTPSCLAYSAFNRCQPPN